VPILTVDAYVPFFLLGAALVPLVILTLLTLAKNIASMKRHES
jgi:hypothetical protein